MPTGRKIAAKRGVRKQISARARFEIFKRDQFTCQDCEATPPGALLHVIGPWQSIGFVTAQIVQEKTRERLAPGAGHATANEKDMRNG